jgi:hypothetical protein
MRMDGKMASRGGRIWSQSSEGMTEEGDQAGGADRASLVAMVAGAVVVVLGMLFSTFYHACLLRFVRQS